MREIKFRVWEEEQEKMFFEPPTSCLPRGDDSDLEHWKWMQYTGLKDKNGVEVYEGDIVEIIKEDECSFKGGIQKITKQVKWDTYYGASWNFGISYKDGSKRWSYPIPDSIEVIGNIYENEELIK